LYNGHFIVNSSYAPREWFFLSPPAPQEQLRSSNSLDAPEEFPGSSLRRCSSQLLRSYETGSAEECLRSNELTPEER